MITINMYVFSGTGNTLLVSQKLKEELLNYNFTCNINKITTGEDIFEEADKIIIAYPIHGFNAPTNVTNFVKNMPVGKSDVYFLKTSGEGLRINNASSYPLVKIVEKKGYRVCGEEHYLMPYNMIFRHSDEMASLMYKTACDRLKNFAEDVASGGVKKVTFPWYAILIQKIFLVERFGMKLNGRFFTVKHDKCIGCNKCSKLCPTANITINNGKFKFGNNCIGCMRCSFNCPKNAIDIGLLNGWKVNGKYNFSADYKKAKIGRYCKKSYERYFLKNKNNSATI